MSLLEWILLTILIAIYITCLFTVVTITFRNGHWIMGVLGFFFPAFWLIGAILPPTENALATAVLEQYRHTAAVAWTVILSILAHGVTANPWARAYGARARRAG